MSAPDSPLEGAKRAALAAGVDPKVVEAAASTPQDYPSFWWAFRDLVPEATMPLLRVVHQIGHEPPPLTDEQRAALADLRAHWQLTAETIEEASTPEARAARILQACQRVRAYRPIAYEPAHRAKSSGLLAVARVAAAFGVPPPPETP